MEIINNNVVKWRYKLENSIKSVHCNRKPACNSYNKYKYGLYVLVWAILLAVFTFIQGQLNQLAIHGNPSLGGLPWGIKRRAGGLNVIPALAGSLHSQPCYSLATKVSNSLSFNCSHFILHFCYLINSFDSLLYYYYTHSLHIIFLIFLCFFFIHILNGTITLYCLLSPQFCREYVFQHLEWREEALGHRSGGQRSALHILFSIYNSVGSSSVQPLEWRERHSVVITGVGKVLSTSCTHFIIP